MYTHVIPWISCSYCHSVCVCIDMCTYVCVQVCKYHVLQSMAQCERAWKKCTAILIIIQGLKTAFSTSLLLENSWKNLKLTLKYYENASISWVQCLYAQCHLCIYTYMYAYIHTCTHVCIYTYMYAYMQVWYACKCLHS